MLLNVNGAAEGEDVSGNASAGKPAAIVELKLGAGPRVWIGREQTPPPPAP